MKKPFIMQFFNALYFLLVIFSFTSTAQNFNLVLKGQLNYPNQNCANIWGYTDSLGNEYALVGANSGLSIVDVTNPSNPIEVKQIPGPSCTWREIKTHGKYAYVTTECAGKGVQIIDLRKLPSTTIPSKFWAPKVNGDTLKTVHALHIDAGYVYLYGSKVAQGVVIADLTDPWNPIVKGTWDQTYIHDGYVRDNILYGGHINNGYFSVMDVTDKTNPTLLQTQNTPSRFTHNTWLTGDSKTLLTTDELPHSFLASYDVADINNITFLDKYQPTPGSGSIVHNTHVKDDWAVTSWYKDGVVIVDAHRPGNLVATAHYDAHPDSGAGFAGTWGVYPYFASGTIVASNISEGLLVFTPTYTRACYLEGTITDSTCGVPLNDVTVQINETAIHETSDITGEYKTGYYLPGTYSVTFSKPGYVSKTFTGINLQPGMVTTIHLKLFSPNNSGINGKVTDDITNQGVNDVNVQFLNPFYNYKFISDSDGSFSRCDFLTNTYNVTVGKWGYQTFCDTGSVITGSSNTPGYKIKKGYYDDFSFGYGWTVSSTTSRGKWIRAVPAPGTYPPADVPNDCMNFAAVTGNNDAVDYLEDGHTLLTSPVIDLTGYTEPYFNYYRWFGFDSSNPGDSMLVGISNGTTLVVVDTVTTFQPFWSLKSYKVSDYLTPTATMKILFFVVEHAPNNTLEAGVDKFVVTDNMPIGVEEKKQTLTVNMNCYPVPFSSTFTIDYLLDKPDINDTYLEITDITGRVLSTSLLHEPFGSVTVSQEFSPGLLLVKLIVGRQVMAAKKIIKQ